ncbi:MAG: hypothetical protein II730_11400 [Bacteroidales bacterium]|nr:hypothetical protein [Bacteroidales bacterium]
MMELLDKINGYLDEIEIVIKTEVPADYRYRLNENFREARNAILRMQKAVEEYSCRQSFGYE